MLVNTSAYGACYLCSRTGISTFIHTTVMDKFKPHGQLSSFKVERFVKFRQMPRPTRVSFMASVLFQNMKKSERESIELEMDLF